ncbi:hypothetical protein [uncultured Polaribacter sp.]|uniref:hypothetical protein n=1 Tax=uncultured Polaribacter sp. TaxID=174711 RepID=UPI002616C873|nr:hypothetical protein [uncultured Polaribacter sp.]
MEKFVMVDGYISMDNKQLFLDINSHKRDLKSRGGWLGVFFAFVGISVLHTFKRIELLKNFFDYFDFGLRILGGITIIVVIIYLIFFRKSNKKLYINEIKKIDVEKQEFETDVSIIFNNKKRLELEFRNLENQLQPFLETIQKRNSRIKIDFIK